MLRPSLWPIAVAQQRSRPDPPPIPPAHSPPPLPQVLTQYAARCLEACAPARARQVLQALQAHGWRVVEGRFETSLDAKGLKQLGEALVEATPTRSVLDNVVRLTSLRSAPPPKHSSHAAQRSPSRRARQRRASYAHTQRPRGHFVARAREAHAPQPRG